MQARIQRGFTLIEAVIVITLVTAALTVGLLYLTSLSKTQQREQLSEKMAQEMAIIERAMVDYMTAPVVDALPSEVRVPVQIQTLINTFHLPTNFALRDGAVGTSPFGQRYVIHVYRIDRALVANESPLTWVITEQGAPLASRLSRVGADDTADAILGVKQTVASLLASQYKLTSGVIKSGTPVTVSGDFNGFSQNVAQQVPASPAANQSWAAVLHGFANLSADDPTDSGIGGDGDDENYQDCEVVKPTCSVSSVAPGCTGSVVAATCPVGKVEAGNFPHCGYRETIFSSTEVGAVTMGSFTQTVSSYADPNNFYACTNTHCTDPAGTFHNRENVYVYGVTTLNNVEIARDLCKVSYTRGTGTSTFQVTSGNAEWPSGSRDLICCTVPE